MISGKLWTGIFALTAIGAVWTTAAEETKSSDHPEFVAFEEYPAHVKKIVYKALELHDRELAYQFGSADPSKGGMDCSGAVHYLLEEVGYKDLPRPSDGFYRWVWEADEFHAVNGHTFDSFEWSELTPGDLVFWTGTYAVDSNRDPAISHVMIYLGEDRDGRKYVFGASDGRRYRGERRPGVGLFDFNLPPPPDGSGTLQANFIGYGSIPQEPPEEE